jgi:hypothetical protein
MNDGNENESGPFGLGTLIHAYTRKQAIADGVLIDVTEAARDEGFVYPVALTAAVWAECVRVPPGVTGQDEAGRLWDILWMLRHAIRANKGQGGSELRFSLLVRNDESKSTPPLTELNSVCGPGDDGTPCLTLMLPEED